MKRRLPTTRPKRPQPSCPSNCSGARTSPRFLRELRPGEIDSIGPQNLPTPNEMEKLCKCYYCQCVWIQPSGAIMGQGARILGFMANPMMGPGWHPRG
jgi:hypothetical protein